jgi:hypothetical protein
MCVKKKKKWRRKKKKHAKETPTNKLFNTGLILAFIKVMCELFNSSHC